MSDILEKILEAKRHELRETMQRISESGLKSLPGYNAPRRPFRATLESSSAPAIIAELKKASPSKGLLRPDFDVPSLAKSYAAGGAAALSVLTEKNFFQGALENLAAAKSACDLPLLRKDFLFHEYQVHEARAAGADAILLIAAALEADQLNTLCALARSIGLETLVEVHNREELDKVLPCGTSIIGVNNRNLKTFVTDINVSMELAKRIPAEVCKISESGIRNHSDIRQLMEAGFKGFLIGETLVKSQDPATMLRELRGEKK